MEGFLVVYIKISSDYESEFSINITLLTRICDQNVILHSSSDREEAIETPVPDTGQSDLRACQIGSERSESSVSSHGLLLERRQNQSPCLNGSTLRLTQPSF